MLNTIHFSGLDIVFLLIIVFLIIRCLMRGFVKEVLSVFAFAGGIIAALVFSGPLSLMLYTYFPDGPWAQVIAFLGLFLGVYIIAKLCERMMYTVIEKVHLENLDRALGVFWGGIEGVLVISVGILAMQWQPWLDVTDMLYKSFIVGILEPVLPFAQRFITGRLDV